MQTGRALTIAAIVGTVLLIPVIVVLGLGLYGSSITGNFPLAPPTGPRIEIDPEHGPVGASIEIRGSEWEPRTLARLEMIVQSARPEIAPTGEVVSVSTALPAVFVAELIVSRAGTFTVETQLPATLPLAPESEVEFVAEARYRGGEAAGEARTRFQIDAGPGRINVLVQTEPGGDPAPNALVELRSEEGELVAAERTGTDGLARLAGLLLGVDYEAHARVAGFGPLRIAAVRAAERDPALVTFVLPEAPAGRVYVGGVPVRGTPPNRSIAVLDLPSLTPLREADQAGPAWAMASDPARARLFMVDEIATAVHVLDVASGGMLAPIPVAFPLQVNVIAVEGQPVRSALVRLFWDVRGQLVMVRIGRTDASGVIVFDNLVVGSTYRVVVSAAGHAQDRLNRPLVTIAPNQITVTNVELRQIDDVRTRGFVVGATVPLPDAGRAPATALVVSDLAVDPRTGRLYLTGSDLQNGHLLVIDPDTGLIVHDWRVPAGVGDVVPAQDGRHVYIANRPFSTVARVDTQTGEERASTIVPSWPEALAINAAGHVFVASLREGRVTRLAPDSLEIEASRELEEGVNRLSIAPDGVTLLVSNLWTDTVTALDADRLTVKFLLPVAKSPRAVAVDPVSGSLIVGSAERGTVAIYGTDDYTLRRSLALGIPINDIATVPLPT